MSLTPTQLQELQTIVLDLGEEFPHNADALWNAAIRIQTGGLGPTSGAGGQVAFDAAVADIKVCQEEVQTYQQRQGSPSSGFDVAVLQVVPATSTFPTGNVGEILYLQTAPNSYIATDQIVIDPAGPNSVQIDEVGTTVFRSVPAASGGVEVNNLSTGAGFERVLTTSDSQVLTAEFVTLALSGQIPNERVLTGSANISVTDNGAGSTVVLDVTAAVLEPEQLFESGTVVLNTRAQGVVGLRSDVGGSVPPIPADNPTAILDFYNITGVTRTGRVGFNGIGGNLDIFNEVHGGDVILAGEDAAGAVVIGLQIDPDAITTLRGDTEIQFRYGGGSNGFQVLAVSDVSFRLHPADGGGFSTDFIQYQSDDNQWYIQGDMRLDDGVGSGIWQSNVNFRFSGASPGSVAPIVIPTNSIPASSTGSLAVAADTGTERGIFLGRSSAFHQNLTDRGPSNAEVKFDVSTDVTTDPGLYNLRMDNVTPASVTEIAIDDTLFNGQDFGTYWGPNLAIGDRLFIKQVNDDSKYVILQIGTAPTDSTGWWRILVSVVASGVIFDDDEPLNVEFIQASTSGFGSVQISGTPADNQLAVWTAPDTLEGDANLTWDGTDLDIIGAGGLVITNGADAVAIRVATDINLTAAGSPDLNITGVIAINAGTVDADFDNLTATDFNGVALTTGGAATNFLNETGAYSVPPSAGVTNPMTAALDGDGFDLNDMGVLFIREQAAQEADVSGQMQFWVRDDAFDQSLRVVTGSGIVIPLAAINESDINTSTIGVTGTGFTEILVSQPKENQRYVYQASFQVSAAATDDFRVELVIDTTATFSGTLSWTGGGSTPGSAGLHSAVGEVITNIVDIDADGSVSPDGVYCTIIGTLINGNQATTTMSLRVAKQADVGGNALVYLGAGHSWRAIQSF